MKIQREKRVLPDRQSQAYKILSLIALSGELPANQITRLSGGGRYKEVKIQELKTKKLIRTYYRDKLRGHRLTGNGKTALLAENPRRFETLLSGNTETGQPKYEITRRLRLQSIAETAVTMHNAGVSIFRDEKPGIFNPDSGNAQTLLVPVPAFYNSREIKELGSDFIKIRGARAVGVLLTATEILVVYNTGGSLLKWDYKSEMRTKTLMKSVLCRERLPHQYPMESVRALMLGSGMEQMYQLLTSTGGVKRNYFVLDGSYDSFLYLTNERNGETVLKLLCDTVKTAELNRILLGNLYERDPGLLIENDAVDESGDPVLFAYDCDMPRITRFNSALGLHQRNGTVICFDFQKETLRRFCRENVRFQTIDLKNFERRFFP